MKLRDSYLVCVERGTMCFAAVTVIILTSYMSATADFMTHEMFSSSMDFKQAHEDIMLATTVLTMLSMIGSILSIVIIFMRNTPWYLNVTWQCVMFFLVFIPFAVQSEFLDTISLIDSAEFYQQCNRLKENKDNRPHIFLAGVGDIKTE